MKREALVVGINEYVHHGHLDVPALDAEKIAQLLEQPKGDLSWSVRRLPEIYPNGQPKLSDTEPVSQATLSDAITDLLYPKTQQPPEIVLLFFAGHGFRQGQGDQSGGFLAATNTKPGTEDKKRSGISLTWLRSQLINSPVKKQIVWLDCCHSGDLLNFTPAEIEQWQLGGDRCLIAACRDDKAAYGIEEHGVLTAVLLQALDPKLHPEGQWINTGTVTDFIEQQLETHALLKRQIPLCRNFGQRIRLWQGTKRITSASSMMRDGRTLSRREYENRQELLSRVKYEVDRRLEDSLHNAVLINLGKQKHPQQVKLPWDAEVKIGNNPTVQLPQKIGIIDVFDDETIAGKLLILGAPGSGKTTTLLELAQELIERAEFDANEPIPIVLNLATWKDSKQSIVDWLKFEIKDKHKVIPEKFIAKWIRERDFLPLLDGLDELDSIAQQKCVEAINNFVNGEYQPRKIVLCSRKEEYEFHKSRLILNNSVFLQPLTEAQKQEYLESVELTAIWAKIKDQPVIIELISAPLFISIMTLAYRSISVEEWSKYDSLEESKQYLFKVYIYEMFRKEIKNIWYSSISKIPNSQIAKYWLTWLSQKLKQNNDTEFLIERMQPNWLNNLFLRKMYFINVGLIGSLIGGLFIGPLWLTSSLMVKDIIQEMIQGNNIQQLIMAQMEKTVFVPKETLQNNYYYIVLAIALISGVISLLLSKFEMEIKPVEIIKIVNPKPVLYASLVGLFCFVIFVLIGTVRSILNFHPLIWVIVVFICQAFQQVIEDFIKSMAEDIMSKDIFIGFLEKEKKSIPNQGIKNSMINAAFLGGILLLIGTILGFLSGHIIGLILWLSSGIKIGNISGITLAHLGGMIGLIFGSLFPSFPCIQHLALRIVFWSNGYIPWNYARFLNYCTERMILQRVGGRYRFIHRLLQEHFANMEFVELSNKTNSN